MMGWFFPSSTETKKHRRFVSEPMGDKDVTELPGIGEVLGGRLRDEGYCEASQVLAQFLRLNKDKAAFQRWLKCVCDANCKQCEDCYRALCDYSNKYMVTNYSL
ncbi:barrier-to-autointegration factor-like [Macrosteles quadrilineatus]|uniref:barrier-to-autointegration factor-like n=1 Tax=Macrosteles quadrilineatus TaxID=74068 RepID=UPI0023E32622|nr:barrier-to-autointegration factor-like [Macrosteles quadrilineatus]